MSSNSVCSTDQKICTQSYPVKDYFLALFVIVVCLVSLRMLLYASYYSWLRLSSRRRRGQQQQSAEEGQPSHPVTSFDNLRGAMASGLPVGEEQSVCVIVAGQDRPTFIAQPAPLASFRNSDCSALSEKGTDETKS